MSKIRSIATLLATAVIAVSCALQPVGCALLQPAELPRAPVSVDPAVQALNDAQDAVNEANTLITAIARNAHEQLAAGIITREEWIDYGLQLSAYANRADEVQIAIRNGVPTAKDAATVLRKTLLILQAKAAAKARK